MTEDDRDKKFQKLKPAVNFDVVSDNLLELAEFTVEKYEFDNQVVFSDEARKAYVAQLKDLLWLEVEELKKRRGRILNELFETAEKSMKDFIDAGG